MPHIPVDDQGTVLQYVDTGAPPGSSTYTTLILMHGIYWNSGIFNPMIPHAASNNLRLVLLNARDNGLSTPYTEAQLKDLTSGDKEIQTNFYKQRVLELAAFVKGYIEQEGIPPLREVEGRRTGGLSFVAWSGGNAAVNPFFAFAGEIPPQTRELLEPYLRSYIIDDPAFLGIGAVVPAADELYNLFRDPDVSQEVKEAEWFPRLAGWYSGHSSYTIQSLSATTLSELPARLPFLKKMQTAPDPASYKIDKAPFDSIVEANALWRSATPLLIVDSTILEGCTEQMLFSGYGDGEDSKGEKYFPKVKVECVSCTASLPECVYGAYWLKRLALERQAKGKDMRKLGFHFIEGGNHPWHWFEPAKSTAFFASIA